MNNEATTDKKHVEDALLAWATTYPRRVTKYQHWVTSLTEATAHILEAERDPDNGAFISTYSFPSGHTKDDGIPRIDRLFIDMDVPDDGEYRSGAEREDAWIRDMSRLLIRVRKVAHFLLNSEDPGCWQASLSGHKGVHLDLVFSEIPTENRSFNQVHNGMGTFSDSLTEYLRSATDMNDLDEYIDVSSADLGRMRRVPNTIHAGATQSFGEDRFCVPVTLAELANIKPADYINFTKSRRPVTDGMKAVPNESAADVLTHNIKIASESDFRHTGGGSSASVDRLVQYEKGQNDRIDVEDLPFVMSDRPCVLSFFEDQQAFSHRSSSHLMEMKAITEMAEKGVPIKLRRDEDGDVLVKKDVPTVVGGTMVEAFANHPRFNRVYTRERVNEYLSRDYSPVSCNKIWQQADQFCLHSDCQIWADEQTDRRTDTLK
jgi:uncharacterized protein YqkB